MFLNFIFSSKITLLWATFWVFILFLIQPKVKKIVRRFQYCLFDLYVWLGIHKKWVKMPIHPSKKFNSFFLSFYMLSQQSKWMLYSCSSVFWLGLTKLFMYFEVIFLSGNSTVNLQTISSKKEMLMYPYSVPKIRHT